jgi:sugar lactone lactonase YvrE
MSRLCVVVAGGWMVGVSALASGQAINATPPAMRVEHVRSFGGGPVPGNLLEPSGIAVDKNGVVLVADTGYGRIQIFDRDGALVRILGTPGRGPGEFRVPKAVATDADGTVYVADTGNQRIQVLTRAGAFVRMWGSEGSHPGQFRSPFGVAVSRNGLVFVTDAYNYRVQVFTREGQFIRMWGGKGNGPGQFLHPNYPGHDGSGPWGVAVDNHGLVYVSDSWNFRVQVFSEDGTFQREFGNLKTPGGAWNTPRAIDASSKCGKLNTPTGVAIGPNGDVYVVTAGMMSTPGAFTIQVFSPDGTCLHRWGGDGHGPGQFETPTGVAVDARGDVFVTDDSNRVHRFRSDGRFETEWGAVGNGRLRKPSDIAVDANGRLYVVERTSSRVQVFTAEGDFLAMWSPRKGEDDGRQLRWPGRIATGSDGRVYVADEGRVLVFSSSGETLDVWGEYDAEGRHRFPWLCAISAEGSDPPYVLLCQSRAVIAVTPDGREVWRVEGLREPWAVTDASGRVNIVERRDGHGRLRVRVLSRSGKDLGSWNVDTPVENPGVTVDREGRLLVSDGKTCTFRLYTRTGTKIAEWGSCGYSDGQFQRWGITGVMADRMGLVYVTDSRLNRVQVFRLTEAK